MSVRYYQSMQSNGIITYHNTTLPIQFKDWVYRYNGEHFANSCLDCLVHVDCFIICLLFDRSPKKQCLENIGDFKDRLHHLRGQEKSPPCRNGQHGIPRIYVIAVNKWCFEVVGRKTRAPADGAGSSRRGFGAGAWKSIWKNGLVFDKKNLFVREGKTFFANLFHNAFHLGKMEI